MNDRLRTDQRVRVSYILHPRTGDKTKLDPPAWGSVVGYVDGTFERVAVALDDVQLHAVCDPEWVKPKQPDSLHIGVPVEISGHVGQVLLRFRVDSRGVQPDGDAVYLYTAHDLPRAHEDGLALARAAADMMKGRMRR